MRSHIAANVCVYSVCIATLWSRCLAISPLPILYNFMSIFVFHSQEQPNSLTLSSLLVFYLLTTLWSIDMKSTRWRVLLFHSCYSVGIFLSTCQTSGACANVCSFGFDSVNLKVLTWTDILLHVLGHRWQVFPTYLSGEISCIRSKPKLKKINLSDIFFFFFYFTCNFAPSMNSSLTLTCSSLGARKSLRP